MFLLHFLDWPGGPKRQWFQWDPEEGQPHSLPGHKWAAARRLHAFGHQQPRETGRAGQQLQGSASAECTAVRKTIPLLLPYPCPQKQVQRGCWHVQSWTLAVSLALIYLCLSAFNECCMLSERDITVPPSNTVIWRHSNFGSASKHERWADGQSPHWILEGTVSYQAYLCILSSSFF